MVSGALVRRRGDHPDFRLMTSGPLRVCFVMEDALGHVTHAQGLRAAVAQEPELAADWLALGYRAPRAGTAWPRMPFSVDLSLRARAAVRQRVAGAAPPQALFFHTQALTPCCLPLIAGMPSMISLDATPQNFREIASAYGERPVQGVVGKLKTAWFRSVFARARGLVAFSHWVRDSLVADYGVPAARVAVLPQGVDTQLWQPADRRLDTTRPLRLLFVGADFKRKGGEALLKAWRAGLSAFCELDIVTRDPEVAECAGLRVHRQLTPNCPALKQLYAQADVFLLPSLGDASPFAVLEAMASGLPVVATRVGAVGEMIDDGVTGWLIERGDTSALVGRVKAMDADRSMLAAFGRAARIAAQSRYDARTNYRRLVDHIRAELAPRRP
jgi:hypothetical protein